LKEKRERLEKRGDIETGKERRYRPWILASMWY